MHLGLWGLWAGLIVALTYCAVGELIICLRTDWIKETKKVEKRLKKERELGDILGVEAEV
jgi:MATE family multidrug resistance protein